MDEYTVMNPYLSTAAAEQQMLSIAVQMIDVSNWHVANVHVAAVALDAASDMV